MSRLKKYIIGIVAGLVLVSSAAYAILPAAVFVWMGASTNMAAALEASLYIHAGAFAAYEFFFAEKGGDGKPTGTPMLTAKLSPSAARSNPDPASFNDPAPGARDVTPKTTVSGSSSGGGSAPALVPGEQWYFNAGAGQWGYSTSAASVIAAVVGSGYSVGACPIDPDGITARCAITRLSDGYQATWNASKVTNGTYSCSGGAYVNGVGCTNAPTSPSPTTCPPGYTVSGTSCNLTDAAQVKKPTTTPCEILRTGAGLQTDSANPNCDGIQVSGNTLQAKSDTALSFNADGSVSVSNPNGQTTFQMSGPNADGSMSITGASRSGNPGSYTPGSSTGGGTSTACGGVGQPSCSGTGGATAGTSGGGSCGGSGQPKCGIDDSGFNGLADPGAAGRSALDTASEGRGTAISNQTDTSSGLGLGFDWVPKPGGYTQACEPFVIHFMGASISWNFCAYLPLLAEVMGYLFYLFTGLYIWKSFMGSRVGGR